jgi:hypothetical protein
MSWYYPDWARSTFSAVGHAAYVAARETAGAVAGATTAVVSAAGTAASATGSAIGSVVSGTVQLVTHPVDTLSNAGQTISHAVTYPGETLRNAGQAIKNGAVAIGSSAASGYSDGSNVARYAVAMAADDHDFQSQNASTTITAADGVSRTIVKTAQALPGGDALASGMARVADTYAPGTSGVLRTAGGDLTVDAVANAIEDPSLKSIGSAAWQVGTQVAVIPAGGVGLKAGVKGATRSVVTNALRDSAKDALKEAAIEQFGEDTGITTAMLASVADNAFTQVQSAGVALMGRKSAQSGQNTDAVATVVSTSFQQDTGISPATFVPVAGNTSAQGQGSGNNVLVGSSTQAGQNTGANGDAASNSLWAALSEVVGMLAQIGITLTASSPTNTQLAEVARGEQQNASILGAQRSTGLHV